MREVQTFPDGPALFGRCNKFGFEGVVSKRLAFTLHGRTKPQLGQDEVPRLEARQTDAGRHKISRARASPS